MNSSGLLALSLVLLPAVLLWAWLAAGAVALFVQLSRTAIWVLFIALASLAAMLLFFFNVPGEVRSLERTPLPCTGDGVDFDTRDGLCYRNVPQQFQRR
jgi:hypothetical protein